MNVLVRSSVPQGGLNIGKCLSPVVSIQKLNRLVTRRFDAALRSLGVSAQQFVLLSTIGGDSVRVRDLATSLGIDKATMSRNIARLIVEQLVVRDSVCGRGGAHRVRLAERGKRIVQEGTPLWEKATGELSFPPGTVAVIGAAINTL